MLGQVGSHRVSVQVGSTGQNNEAHIRETAHNTNKPRTSESWEGNISDGVARGTPDGGVGLVTLLACNIKASRRSNPCRFGPKPTQFPRSVC